jgi:hypothetical protein
LIGQALLQIKLRRDQGIKWKDFVKDNFSFSVSTADRHIRTYEQFKDNPKEIKNKIMAELNGEKERVKHEYNRIAEGGAAERGADAWDTVFSLPTVSGAPLKNYRFETVGGDSIWLYDRKAGMRARALRLEAVEARPDTRKELSLMMNSIQAAVERYYAALESVERED